MKQAILIMMHKNIEQLKRLVRFFPSDRCTCFIHADKKFDMDTALIQSELDNVNTNCIVLPKRISGQLANWSLADISLELIKFAYEYGERNHIRFQYYRLLSGQDYPIKSFQEYEDFLSDNYPKNFMGINRYDEGIKHVIDKYSRWRFNAMRSIIDDHVSNSVLRKGLIIPLHALESVYTWIKGTPYCFLSQRGYQVVGGPSWWNISDKLAAYIVDVISEKNEMIETIKRIATPEEAIIQMIFVNSPLWHGKFTENLTIGNYGRRNQARNGHTHPWSIMDYEELINTKCFFARKFDMDFDSEILDEMDKRIYGKTVLTEDDTNEEK